MKTYYFDMDGTIANFYGVEGWLTYLQNHDATPYEIAEPLYNVIELRTTLKALKDNGNRLIVISWLSKTSTKEFDEKVIKAKKKWLDKYELTDLMDEIIITPYGVRKADTCRKYGNGILIDDEERNRKEWDLGDTINATENILEILRKI